jgi:hypothetical protein
MARLTGSAIYLGECEAETRARDAATGSGAEGGAEGAEPGRASGRAGGLHRLEARRAERAAGNKSAGRARVPGLRCSKELCKRAGWARVQVRRQAVVLR